MRGRRFLLAEVFEESLHGVVVGLRQLLDQIFDGLNSVLEICNLCTTEHQRLKGHPTAALFTFTRGLTGLRVVYNNYNRSVTGTFTCPSGFWVIFKVL